MFSVSGIGSESVQGAMQSRKAVEKFEIQEMVLATTQHEWKERGNGAFLCRMPPGWHQSAARLGGGSGSKSVSKGNVVHIYD
jgi:hypothetical protein